MNDVDQRSNSLTERYALQRLLVGDVLNGASVATVAAQSGIPAYRVKSMLVDCLRRIDANICMRRAELRERGPSLNREVALTATMPGSHYDLPFFDIPLHYLAIPTGRLLQMRFVGVCTLGEFVARPRVEVLAIRNMTPRSYQEIVDVIAEVLRHEILPHQSLHQLSTKVSDAESLASLRRAIGWD